MKKFLIGAVAAMGMLFASQSMAQVFKSPTYYVSGSFGSSFQEVNERTNQWVVGLGFGVDWGAVRLEAGYDRYQDAGGNFALGKVDANLVGGRVFLEHDFGMLVPYVSAGAGYSWLTGAGTNVSGPQNGFTYMLGTGVNFQVAKNLSFGVGYEYVRSAANVMEANGTTEDWRAHQVKAIVKFNLN